MAEPDLRFIGERLERVQAELRNLRALKGEVAAVQADLARFKAEVAGGFDAMRDRIDRLEATMDARFGQMHQQFGCLEAAMGARFDQVHQTMATNLAVVLEALKTRSPD